IRDVVRRYRWIGERKGPPPDVIGDDGGGEGEADCRGQPAGVVTASLIGRVARDLWRNRAVYERSPFRCVMVAARREVERRGQRVLLLGGVQGAHKRYVVERQEKKLSVQSQLCCRRFPERLLQTLPQRLGIVSRLDPRIGEDPLLIFIG